MTQAEFNKIPKAEDLPKGGLQEKPIGFKFICKKNQPSECTILGEIVKTDDILTEQLGAGLLSAPKQSVNRYRIVITDKGSGE